MPLGAAIIAVVVDAFDLMTTDTPNCTSMSIGEAVERLKGWNVGVFQASMR